MNNSIKNEMPEVLKCEVSDCVYNQRNMCHARGITVGDGLAHLCDTHFLGGKHTRRNDLAGVGACRAMTCKHNDDFECQADGVSIGLCSGHAECLTFDAKQGR